MASFTVLDTKPPPTKTGDGCFGDSVWNIGGSWLFIDLSIPIETEISKNGGGQISSVLEISKINPSYDIHYYRIYGFVWTPRWCSSHSFWTSVLAAIGVNSLKQFLSFRDLSQLSAFFVKSCSFIDIVFTPIFEIFNICVSRSYCVVISSSNDAWFLFGIVCRRELLILREWSGFLLFARSSRLFLCNSDLFVFSCSTDNRCVWYKRIHGCVSLASL